MSYFMITELLWYGAFYVIIILCFEVVHFRFYSESYFPWKKIEIKAIFYEWMYVFKTFVEAQNKVNDWISVFMLR